MTEFGTIVTPHDVSHALEQHIKTWQRTALDLVAQGRGFSRRLESIRSYRHTAERPEKWDEDAVPCCVIVVGPSDTERDTDGFSLVFTAAVATVVGPRDQQTGEKLASAYGGALALLLNQRPGFTVGPQQAEAEIAGWGGFDTGQLDATIAMAVCGYSIFISDALTLGEWPAVPTPDPAPGTPPTYPDTPTAETVEFRIDQTR